MQHLCRGEYARGIAEGAPKVEQVADRWHLLRNLREALERLLNRYHAQLSRLPVAGRSGQHSVAPLVQRPRRLRGVTESERLRQQARRQQFDAWLAKGRESGLPDLQSFAEGLQPDREAVLGAMTEEWSNGQVEGQITRLKLVKRQMYGRAKLDLLRKRVLHAA